MYTIIVESNFSLSNRVLQSTKGVCKTFRRERVAEKLLEKKGWVKNPFGTWEKKGWRAHILPIWHENALDV